MQPTPEMMEQLNNPDMIQMAQRMMSSMEPEVRILIIRRRSASYYLWGPHFRETLIGSLALTTPDFERWKRWKLTCGVVT